MNNHYQQEKLQIFGDIESVNPYAMEGSDEADNEGEEEEESDEF